MTRELTVAKARSRQFSETQFVEKLSKRALGRANLLRHTA